MFDQTDTRKNHLINKRRFDYALKEQRQNTTKAHLHT